MKRIWRIVCIAVISVLIAALIPGAATAKSDDAAPPSPRQVDQTQHIPLRPEVEQKFTISNGASISVPVGAVPEGAHMDVDVISYLGPSAGPSGLKQYPLSITVAVKVMDKDNGKIKRLSDFALVCLPMSQEIWDMVKEKNHSLYIARNSDPYNTLSGYWAPLPTFIDLNGMQVCTLTRYLMGFYTLIEY